MLQNDTTTQTLNAANASTLTVITPPPGTTAYVYRGSNLPDYVKQAVVISTVPSLKDYLVRMVTDPGNLAVYANVNSTDSESMKIFCMLDACENATTPCANVNKASYTLELSHEATQFKNVLDKPMDQGVFLEWLEENAGRIEDVATLLTAAEVFESVTVTRFKSAKRLQNGMMHLLYDTDEQTDEGLKMPAELKINLPVFMGEPSVTLPVMIRYRTTNGKLTFTLVCPVFKPLIRDTAVALCEAFGAWLLNHEWPAGRKPLFALGRLVSCGEIAPPSITEHKGGLLPTTVGALEA